MMLCCRGVGSATSNPFAFVPSRSRSPQQATLITGVHVCGAEDRYQEPTRSLDSTCLLRFRAYRQRLRFSCVNQVISGLNKFDADLVTKVAKAAAAGGGTLIDIACDPELVRAAKSVADIPVNACTLFVCVSRFACSHCTESSVLLTRVQSSCEVPCSFQ